MMTVLMSVQNEHNAPYGFQAQTAMVPCSLLPPTRRIRVLQRAKMSAIMNCSRSPATFSGAEVAVGGLIVTSRQLKYRSEQKESTVSEHVIKPHDAKPSPIGELASYL